MAISDRRFNFLASANKKQDYLYCDKLVEKLDIVKDNVIQMHGLALSFERTKSRILKRQLSNAERKQSAVIEDNNIDLVVHLLLRVNPTVDSLLSGKK